MEKNPDKPVVLLAHGDGGALTRDLVEGLFLRHFHHGSPPPPVDAAVLEGCGGRLALTTDSFVVEPPFFEGGDIGKLAVCGTVNDLAVSGAVPRYLTASFILEEGLPLADLERVVRSMAAACAEAGVRVVAGDTKVVPRGHLDGIFITTTGAGWLPDGVELGFHRLSPGDAVLLNGGLGEHGLAVLARRFGLALAGRVVSDCAPLNGIIEVLLAHCPGVKIMRDLTRGGLATALKEIAAAAGVDFHLDEEALPVRDVVRGAAEMLGLDPLYLANEGKFIAVVDAREERRALEAMRAHPLGRRAAVIGRVEAGRGNVYLKTAMGGTRFLDLLAGEPLPRIC